MMKTLAPAPFVTPIENLHSMLEDRTVCLVDDDPNQLRILRGYLEKTGARFEAFDTGEAALAFLREEPVALLLLDVMMPGVDGWSLYSHLRRISHHADTPVLFITCLANSLMEKEMNDPGYCATLRKPVDRDRLYREILSLL